jgi:predicted ATP-dependent serine protease
MKISDNIHFVCNKCLKTTNTILNTQFEGHCDNCGKNNTKEEFMKNRFEFKREDTHLIQKEFDKIWDEKVDLIKERRIEKINKLLDD